MDNEKLNNEETVEEVTEETVEAVETEEVAEEAVVEEVAEESAAEETEEEVEEVSEEDAETVEDEAVTIVQIWQCPKCETVCDEEICSACGEQCELIEIEATAGEITEGPRKNIGAIIGGAVAAVVVLVAALWYFGVINPYEKGYIDTTGETLEQLADKRGYTVNEFKKMYSLPWLMPKSTNANAVDNNIPVSYLIEQQNKQSEMYASMYGQEYVPITIESFRAEMGLSEKITEKSPIGKVRGELNLRSLLNLTNVDEETAKQEFDKYKKENGLGEDVTLDTLYKDVRVAIDKKTREKRIEQEKEAEKADEEPEEDSDADVETKDAETEPAAEEAPTEAPAEEKVAE